MSEPLWCEVRRHYCRCHETGKRCDDLLDEKDEHPEPPAAPGSPSETK